MRITLTPMAASASDYVKGSGQFDVLNRVGKELTTTSRELESSA
jgi:hypothetical protein